MNLTALTRFRQFNRNVRLFMVSVGLTGFSFWGINTMLLNLYLLRLGYGPEAVGVVNAVGMGGAALFCLPAGFIGGRWGVRRAMIAGQVAVMLGFLALPLGEFAPEGWRRGWVLGSNVLSAVGLSLYLVNNSPFLMAAATAEERGYAFSLQTAVQTLVGFLGCLAAGVMPGLMASLLHLPLSHPAPYRYPLLLAGAILLPSVLALLRTEEVSVALPPAAQATQRAGAPRRLIALLAVLTLLRQAGTGVTRSFFNVYLDAGLGAPTTLIGTLSAVGQLLAAFTMLSLPWLVARLTYGGTTVLAGVGTALALASFVLFPQWGVVGASRIALFALGSLGDTAAGVYQMQLVAPRWRSLVNGATSAALALSWAATALGGGYIITAMGYGALFGGAAGLALAGALLLLLITRVVPAAQEGG
jgi:hypothetical protein